MASLELNQMAALPYLVAGKVRVVLGLLLDVDDLVSVLLGVLKQLDELNQCGMPKHGVAFCLQLIEFPGIDDVLVVGNLEGADGKRAAAIVVHPHPQVVADISS